MKHKNLDLPPQLMLLLIGLILVGMVAVALKIQVSSLAKASDKLIDKQQEIMDDYVEYDLTKWDNQEVPGSYVRNFVKENLGEYTASETAPIYVSVKTVVSSVAYTNSYANEVHIKDISNFSSTQYYINPTATYSCEVIRNTNKVILGISFVQK